MANAPKHLIFDFGAVVFRWEPLALMQAVLPAHAPDAAAARALADRVFKGYTGAWGGFDAGTISRDELVPALAEQAGLRADEVEALIDAIPPHLQPLPATLALIDELQAAGHRLFYLSNMPLAFADHLEQHQAAVLQRFEDGVFSARVRLAKPDPAIFTQALRQFGVAAADCVFLDDHPANIEAARALAIGAVLFTDAASARPALRGLGVPVAAGPTGV
jgi:HAD superfamily hydrolase (TIGR01509 family)